MNTFNEYLKEEFNIDYFNLYLFSLNASQKYKVYSIPKRNGKLRVIHHPAKELKEHQRLLAKIVFSKLPIHEAVFSYRKNISIKDLAVFHKANRFLIRIDLTDFFHSITAKNIREYLLKNLSNFDFKLTNNDITLINSIVCRFDSLTIGAPSSPMISNTLLYEFDVAMNQFSTDIKYSRYADDLYFSCNKPDILKSVIPFIKDFLSKYYIKLKINEDKNIFTSKKRKRTITGLVLTTDNKVSIGKNKKNEIKTLVYKYTQGNILDKELIYLKGYLSYIKSVEESFLVALNNKYSKDIMDSLIL